MAITNVEQREIVEIPFTMPDGSILPHPALVISRNELQVDESGSGDRYLNHLYTNKKWHVKQERIQIMSPDPRRGTFGEM